MFEVSQKNTDMVKLLNRQGSEEESESKDESAAPLIAVHSSDNTRMPSKPISLPTESEVLSRRTKEFVSARNVHGFGTLLQFAGQFGTGCCSDEREYDSRNYRGNLINTDASGSIRGGGFF